MFPKEMLVVAFIVVVVFYYICKFFTERYMRKKEMNEAASPDKAHLHSADDCSDAGCAMRYVCSGKEKDEVMYFDDEELDRFKNRTADSYSIGEVEEFREVMATMRGDEVASWLNSLCSREINLPVSLRQEAIALVNKNKIK